MNTSHVAEGGRAGSSPHVFQARMLQADMDPTSRPTAASHNRERGEDRSCPDLTCLLSPSTAVMLPQLSSDAGAQIG